MYNAAHSLEKESFKHVCHVPAVLVSYATGVTPLLLLPLPTTSGTPTVLALFVSLDLCSFFDRLVVGGEGVASEGWYS